MMFILQTTSGSLTLSVTYKVKFESSYRKSSNVKQVIAKQMAYTSPCPVRFPVGTRVIAIFQDNDWSKECYYSGVVAEPPKSMNKYRSVCDLTHDCLTCSGLTLSPRFGWLLSLNSYTMSSRHLEFALRL
jgi:hypothetical protein